MVAATGVFATLVVLIRLITSNGPHINITKQTRSIPPSNTLMTRPCLSPKFLGESYIEQSQIII